MEAPLYLKKKTLLDRIPKRSHFLENNKLLSPYWKVSQRSLTLFTAHHFHIVTNKKIPTSP